MGLDIWSYDYDRTADFSKYNYIKSQFDIFIDTIEKTKVIELYTEHICNSQYLRSSYNGYGYDTFARIYNCIELLDILHPMIYDKNKNINNIISKEAIYQSLGIAKENLAKWKLIELLNNENQIYRYDVIKYNGDSTFNNIFYTIATNQFIRYNNFTCELIDKSISNLSKRKYKKYLKQYNNYIQDTEVKGIVEVDGNILVLFKDDISWYRKTAEIVVDFIETLLMMEEPIVEYWG